MNMNKIMLRGHNLNGSVCKNAYAILSKKYRSVFGFTPNGKFSSYSTN